MAKEEIIPAQPVESDIDQIPGIGIIRVRALRKAGWPTIASLRNANLENLLAVPGMTEIKAGQILEFVASQTPVAEAPTPKVKKDKKPKAAKVKAEESPTAEVVQAPVVEETAAPEEADKETKPADGKRVLSETSLPQAIRDVAANAARVATRPGAVGGNDNLAKQLARWVSLPEKLSLDTRLSQKRIQKCVEAIIETHSILAELAMGSHLKTKHLDHSAESLREHRRTLEEQLKI